MRIVQACNRVEIEHARQLFLEYSEQIGIDLCFQGFEQELKELPGSYAPPEGRLLIAYDSKDNPTGCAALRKITSEICEMKRLYLRSEYRGKGIGRLLAEQIIYESKLIGYSKIQLDTLPMMKEAISMYKSMGFKEIRSYTYNPVKGALFFQLGL